MYVIVAGAGVLGSALAASLIAAGHEVFVIDEDETRVAQVQKELGSVAKAGYPASVETLMSAGASRAQIFVAVTECDEDNLAACQLAKGLLQVERTVALANIPDNAQVFEVAGVDAVVSAVDVLVGSLAGALPAHPLIRLMPVASRTREVVGIKVPAKSTAVGKAIRDLVLPYGSQIALVVTSDGRVQLAMHDTVLQAEDELIAVAPRDATETLWEALTELK